MSAGAQLSLFDAPPAGAPMDLRRIAFRHSLGGLDVLLDGKSVPGWLCGTVPAPPRGYDYTGDYLPPYRISRCCWSPGTYATRELAALALIERNRQLTEQYPDIPSDNLGRWCIPWEPTAAARCAACGGPVLAPEDIRADRAKRQAAVREWENA